MTGKHLANSSYVFIRTNADSIYTESVVLETLKDKYEAAVKYSNTPIGKKNLVYFTLNYNLEYIDLFIYSLKSIVNKDTPEQFDVLVICPPLFEDRINELIDANGIDLKGFNLLFYSVPESVDGVCASMNKLNIYRWERIHEYGKVLFLDADVLANKPLSTLFDLQLDPDKLHAAIHIPSDNLHNTKYHKLLNYDLAKMNEFRDKGVYAFNAGQYLFVNSLKMLNHFYNVDWLSTAWPGEYFFEQSYLNHYFNWYCISDVHLLNPHVKFVAVHLWDKGGAINQSKTDYTIVHFAGHACDAAKKMEYIRTFNPELLSNNV